MAKKYSGKPLGANRSCMRQIAPFKPLSFKQHRQIINEICHIFGSLNGLAPLWHDMPIQFQAAMKPGFHEITEKYYRDYRPTLPSHDRGCKPQTNYQEPPDGLEMPIGLMSAPR